MNINLTLYQTIPTLKEKALENTVGKGENADNQRFFLLFPQGFLRYQRQVLPFKPQLNCCLQIMSNLEK